MFKTEKRERDKPKHRKKGKRGVEKAPREGEKRGGGCFERGFENVTMRGKLKFNCTNLQSEAKRLNPQGGRRGMKKREEGQIDKRGLDLQCAVTEGLPEEWGPDGLAALPNTGIWEKKEGSKKGKVGDVTTVK